MIVAVAAFAIAVAAAGSPVNLTALTDPAVPIETRVKLARDLGASKDPKAVDVLLAGLDIRHDELHAAIVASLKQQKGDVLLVTRAADAKRPGAERVAALAGVRVLKPADAAPKIAALLDPAVVKEEAVRAAAAHTLCVFGAAAAEAQLVKALGDGAKDVRYYAATALGGLKTASAKQAVNARAKTETDFVVQDALAEAQRRQATP